MNGADFVFGEYVSTSKHTVVHNFLTVQNCPSFLYRPLPPFRHLSDTSPCDPRACDPRVCRQNMAADAAVALLKREKGVDWYDVPPVHRYGLYVKKEQFTKKGVDPRSGAETTATRTRFARR